jgi:membrane protease YdiL (CAAX protease family)
MNTDPANITPIVPVPESTPGALEPGGFRKVFIGPNGIRAGWRLAMFVLLFAALQFLIVRRGMQLIPAVAAIASQAQTGGEERPQFSLLFDGASLALAFLAAGIMSRIEKRPFSTYGIPWSGAFGKMFWQGALWGLVFETFTILAISAFRGFTFGTFSLAGTALAKFAILWAIGFVLVGMLEEFLFRGYAQFTLASGIGFWPAALFLSALFGALHLSNPGEGWVGALSVSLFGVFGCLTLRRTGNLWFAIGLHAAGDYAETFIFSVPDSGMTATGHLLNSSLHGPRWLTGGSIGPEGSVMCFILFAISFAAFNRLYPAKKAEGSR